MTKQEHNIDALKSFSQKFEIKYPGPGPELEHTVARALLPLSKA